MLRITTEREAIALGLVGPHGGAPERVANIARPHLRRPTPALPPEHPLHPQRQLFDALRQRFPQEPLEWEASHLVPGRKFRADILIPRLRLIIELDGFAYHRSKSAFRSDRERQNLLVLHGYRVLRYTNKHVQSHLPEILDALSPLLRGSPHVRST